MRAADILPFCFAMGAMTLVLYLVSGEAIFLGQNTAYLGVTVYVILWAIEKKRERMA